MIKKRHIPEGTMRGGLIVHGCGCTNGSGFASGRSHGPRQEERIKTVRGIDATGEYQHLGKSRIPPRMVSTRVIDSRDPYDNW